MRSVLWFALWAGVTAGVVAVSAMSVLAVGQPPAVVPKTEPAPSAVKSTPAAEFTLTKLLKTPVSGDFTDVPLGEILKEFAHQVEEKADDLLMWAYGTEFPFARKVSFAVNNQPLEVALDELLKKIGGGLGYVVVSKEGDKYDGWVRLTTTGERGHEAPPASAEDEMTAADRLALAKKLVDGGKLTSARPLLELIIRKYPTTKAAVQAKQLLEKIETDK